MIDQIGGRKLVAGLVILATGVAICLAKGDIPANLLQLLQVLFGAFVLGNGVEHVAGAIASRSESAPVVATPEPTPVTFQPVDFTPVLAEIHKLQDASAVTQAGVSTLVQYVYGQVQQPTK